MNNLEDLCSFLVKAKKATYASGDKTSEIIEPDGSTSLHFKDGDYKYHDNYFGGEPYGGREVVFFKDQPIYIMAYYGSVNEGVASFGEIYKVLQQALLLIPENKPYRGPEKYVQGGYVYLNNFSGEVDNFSGEEKIVLVGKEIYRAKYAGGLVNQRK